MSISLVSALLLFCPYNDSLRVVGVNALVIPPRPQQHRHDPIVDSIKLHSYPHQHNHLKERYSFFSQSSDSSPRTSESDQQMPVSHQRPERKQNANKPSPNEVLWMRRATIDDIPALQRCNRALLPENYPDRFYESYLRQFPDLTVIVESFALDESEQREDWIDASQSLPSTQPVAIAYAMGCIREVPATTPLKFSQQEQQQQRWQFLNKKSSTEDRYSDYNGVYRPLALSGHTISLAVMPTHRKMGLASKLLEYLHDSMEHRYGAVVCDLSVRVSNEKAVRLYENHGYGVSERLNDYYKNGKLEDGYKMQRVLSDSQRDSSAASPIALPQQMFVYRPKGDYDYVSHW